MSLEYPCVHHVDGKCKLFSDDGSISFCVYGPCRYETPSNADRIRVMSDMELAQWMASRIANLKFLDIEMSGKQLTAAEKAALTHDLYVVFGRYLQQPAEEDGRES